MTMTKGEYRVGISFNPSGDNMVGQIKAKVAELIDLIDTIPLKGGSTSAQFNEINRLKALAQTNIEDAAMWGVKAATKGPMS